MSVSFYSDGCGPVSLEDWRRWMNLSPLAFYDLQLYTCANSNGEDYVYCKDAMFVQDNTITGNNESQLSLELLARVIDRATAIIEDELGFPLKPKTVKETIQIPYHFRRELGHAFIEGWTKLQTKNNYIRKGHMEVEQLASNIPVVYTDEDFDFVSETATITVTGISSPNFNGEQCSIKIVPAGSYEEYGKYMCLSPQRKFKYDADAGTLTIVLDSWMMKRVDLRESRAFLRSRSTDYCNTDNLIQAVDVYFEWLNPCDTYSHFLYSNGKSDCPDDTCAPETSPLCYVVTDPCEGYFLPKRAGISELTGCYVGDGDAYCCAIEPFCEVTPDKVCIEYTWGCDCMCKELPQLCDAIIMLASSMLPMLWCIECLPMLVELQSDAAWQPAGNNSQKFSYNDETKNNPFGSKLGAIRAWKIVQSIKEDLDCTSFSCLDC